MICKIFIANCCIATRIEWPIACSSRKLNEILQRRSAKSQKWLHFMHKLHCCSIWFICVSYASYQTPSQNSYFSRQRSHLYAFQNAVILRIEILHIWNMYLFIVCYRHWNDRTLNWNKRYFKSLRVAAAQRRVSGSC